MRSAVQDPIRKLLNPKPLSWLEGNGSRFSVRLELAVLRIFGPMVRRIAACQSDVPHAAGCFVEHSDIRVIVNRTLSLSERAMIHCAMQRDSRIALPTGHKSSAA